MKGDNALYQSDPFAALLQPLWLAAQAGQFGIVTSELTWLETLTKPLRDGNASLETLFRAFLTAREVAMVQATLPIWEHAARLRGFGLKVGSISRGRFEARILELVGEYVVDQTGVQLHRCPMDTDARIGCAAPLSP